MTLVVSDVRRGPVGTVVTYALTDDAGNPLERGQLTFDSFISLVDLTAELRAWVTARAFEAGLDTTSLDDLAPLVGQVITPLVDPTDTAPVEAAIADVPVAVLGAPGMLPSEEPVAVLAAPTPSPVGPVVAPLPVGS